MKVPEDITYLKLNPRIILTLADHLLTTDMTLEYLKADGSPNTYEYPGDDQLAHLAREMVQAVGPMDMRILYLVLTALQERVGEALLGAVNQTHAVVHQMELPDHIEEKKLCEALNDYLMESMDDAEAPEMEVHPDTGLDQSDIDERLRGFFTQGQKPN